MSSKQIFKIVMTLIGIITLSSCGSNDSQTRYVAAKLVDSDMWSIVDVNSGDVIHKDEFKSQPSVIVNDKFCVKNESGLYDYYSVDNVTKPLNKEAYLYATSFNDNDIALAVLKGKPISIINGGCEIIANLDNSITRAFDFSNGLAVVGNDDDKFGFVNEKGEIVVKLKYDNAYPFTKDGIAIVSKKENKSVTIYYAINDKAEELFSFSSNDYKDFGSFVNGYIPVQKNNNEIVLLDKNGKRHCSIGKWNGYIPYWLGINDGVIVFKDGNSYGLKNEEGDIVVRAKYDSLIPIPEINKKYYLATKQDKYGVVDKDDNVIIPFDYTVLRYINKDVLIVGEGKNFSFMDKDLKDIGQNNYTNLSFMTGSIIESNYFNAEKEALKIIEHINDSTFFDTHKGMKLRDFKDKITGSIYSYLNTNLLLDENGDEGTIYAFNKNIASRSVEYIFGYRFDGSPEYNYSAELLMTMEIKRLKKFQSDAEENLAKAFDSKIQNIGFKPMEGHPHMFKNPKTGMTVAMGYDDANVFVYCFFDDTYLSNVTIDRKPRKDDSDEDIDVDYTDTFGIDGPSVVQDSDTVVAVEVVEEY